MIFSSPLLLLLLLPLIGMLVWLCTGRLARQDVPFVYLWQDSTGLAQPATAWRWPPVWPILLLLAAMLAIVAAAGPMRAVDQPITEPAFTLENFSVRNRQAMVRLRGGAVPTRAGVSLASGDVSQHVSIDLPAGDSRDYFFDVPIDPPAVRVNLDANGKPTLHAEAIRQQRQLTIVDSGSLPEAVSRIIDVYSTHRPGDPSAGRVLVLAGNAQPIAGPAIFVDDPAMSIGGRAAAPATQPITGLPSEATAILADVDWDHALADAAFAAPPGEGWQTLFAHAGQPAICIRTAPDRQAWVGFDSPAFARSPAFVEFWTNLIDWVTGGGQGETSYAITTTAEPAALPSLGVQRVMISAPTPWLLAAIVLSLAGACVASAVARS